ncbi:hypothetical protein CANMA_004311 [Candida margitis]|uniref:uncharacterized protein n=1 Tax=Candida margitis TaxID=1775924 RepID=UPI002228067E|nr:uncharacterized protein CANMA_004311 [Candida margitis]KAI5958157.1 hypothetical protein CANMA_004311 [Candida margitis]
MSSYESYGSSVACSGTAQVLDTGSASTLPQLDSGQEPLIILFSKVIHIIDCCPYHDTHELLAAHRQLCDNLSLLTDITSSHSQDKESFTAFMSNNRLDYIMNKVIFDSFLNGAVAYTTYKTFRPTHQLIAILFSICESCQVTFQRELFLESMTKMITLRAQSLVANRFDSNSVIGSLIEDVLSKIAPDPEIAEILKEQLQHCCSSNEAIFLISDIAAFTTNLNKEANIDPEDFNQLKKTFEEILVILLTRNYNELERDTYKLIRDRYNSYFHHINLNTGVYSNSLQQNSDLYRYEFSNGDHQQNVTVEQEPQSRPANSWVPSFLEDDYYNENTNTVHHVEMFERPTRNPFKKLFRRRPPTDKKQRWHLFHRKQQEV